MSKRVKVILSALIPCPGSWEISEESLSVMKSILKLEEGEWTNYVQHETVKLLGIEPAEKHSILQGGYDEALVIKPNGRLEFGKEYTLEEIEEIGVTCYLAVRGY